MCVSLRAYLLELCSMHMCIWTIFRASLLRIIFISYEALHSCQVILYTQYQIELHTKQRSISSPQVKFCKSILLHSHFLFHLTTAFIQTNIQTVHLLWTKSYRREVRLFKVERIGRETYHLYKGSFSTKVIRLASDSQPVDHGPLVVH